MKERFMHHIQKHILRDLLFRNKARFSELNTQNISNDHFTFHIKKLVEQNLVGKDGQGFYDLTISGKEYANRLNTDIGKVEIEKQAKVGALVVCVDKDRYLIQQRLKHPFYGLHGFISGKIGWGETIYEAGLRELMEETGLSADLKLVGIEHKIDHSEEGKLLEDKFFYIMKAERPKGQLVEDFEGGKNKWLTKKQILNEFETFQDVPRIMEVAEKENFDFFEKRYKVKKY